MIPKDQNPITLTHVCRAWRRAFISRSSLWTDFDCPNLNGDKTRVYLERSKSSPIALRLYEDDDLSPHHPFFQIIPHAIGRLKSLVINGTPGNLQDITTHLSRPAPLLESLLIDGNYTCRPKRHPMLTTALFDGNFPSLRDLSLRSVRTELPWRSMVNLTSFALYNISPYEVSIRQLLDFFESAPRLRKVQLCSSSRTSDAQNGRLVSLACLKWMRIIGDGSPSFLLDHLIIPVGAELISRGPLTENLLPRSLDNLRNLPNFTNVHLHLDECDPYIRFSGPNGQVCMYPSPRGNPTCVALEILARFDTSKTERLKIDYAYSPPYRALSLMKHLRTLTLSHCTHPNSFIYTLDPDMNSPGVTDYPKLEELILVLRPDGDTLNANHVIKMAAARASRGAKLKSVRIVSQDSFMGTDAPELRKYVLHVECGPGDDAANEGAYVSDDEN
jgi:hypothetical protein